ncbi:winged helix-turn-helix domain-containing protein [Shigella flexneri]
MATGLQSWRDYTQNGYCDEIWGINFDSDTNTVDVAIRRLRES